MRDETDCWGHKQLAVFKACPLVNATRVRVVAERVNGKLDEAKIQQFAEYRASLAEAEEAKVVVAAKKEPPVSTPVTLSVSHRLCR